MKFKKLMDLIASGSKRVAFRPLEAYVEHAGCTKLIDGRWKLNDAGFDKETIRSQPIEEFSCPTSFELGVDGQSVNHFELEITIADLPLSWQEEQDSPKNASDFSNILANHIKKHQAHYFISQSGYPTLPEPDDDNEADVVEQELDDHEE